MIPAAGEDARLFARLPLLRDRPVLGCSIAAALSILAFVVRDALDPLLPPGYPYLTFFPAVIISSFVLGVAPGIVAALLSGLLAWYFFIPPLRSFGLDSGTQLALVFYVAIVTVDIALVHWMQRANRRLRDARERGRALIETSRRLAERNALLFGELQHRVSNNLQMIGAVLSLQRSTIDDPVARKALDDAAGKLQMIGRIQRKLYDIGGARAGLGEYLRDLTSDLAAAGGKPGIRYAIDVEDGILIDPDALIPLALIMAEAVANAVEHGFADRDSGNIAITVRRLADRIELRVVDDGSGLADDFDLALQTSLGLKIAQILATQLSATFLLEPAEQGGTRMILAIPSVPDRRG